MVFLNYVKTGIIVVLITTLISCKKDNSVTVKPAEITFKKEGELTLHKGTNDSLLAKLNIEIAKSEYDIQTGLMYRNNMKENQGMLFVFPDIRERSFYMKNTRIPLDLVFLDHNKTIVSFQENAKPLNETSLPSNALAQFVLEINAGLAEKWVLEVGDKMDYFEYKIVE